MKRLILVTLFFSLISTTAFSQAKVDSIEVEIDTIHVRGFVFDKFDKPMADVKVGSERFSTKTTKNGFFELKGIDKKSLIYFETDTLTRYHIVNESRFIIYHLTKVTNMLSPHSSGLSILAKRELPRVLIKRKIPDIYCYNILRESLPQYPGGMPKFYQYIQENLVYPEKAIKNNIEGTVGIQFDVTTTGQLANFKIIKDIYYGCAEALVEVLKKSKKWNPGMIGGKPSINPYYIEIPFKLID
jgi:hypothetical protein